MNARSPRAYARLSCGAKTCCAAGTRVTGADVVRISRALALEPWDFVEVSVHDGVTDVLLRPGKHGCVFLLRTTTGAARCGLGDLAPTGCRVFPADTATETPTLRAEVGCACRAWRPGDLEPELADELSVAAAEEWQWQRLRTAWRDYAGGTEIETGAQDLLRYVLDVYAELDAGADWES